MEVLRREGDLEAVLPSGRNVMLAWRISRWTHMNRDLMTYRPWSEVRHMFEEGRSVVTRRVYQFPLGVIYKRPEAHAALREFLETKGN